MEDFSKKNLLLRLVIIIVMSSGVNAKLLSHVVADQKFLVLNTKKRTSFITLENKMNNIQYVRIELSKGYVDESGILQSKETDHPQLYRKILIAPRKLIIKPHSKKKFRVTSFINKKTEKETYFTVFNEYVPAESIDAKSRKSSETNKGPRIIVNRIIKSRVLLIIPPLNSKMDYKMSYHNEKITIKNIGNTFFRLTDFRLCNRGDCKYASALSGADVYPGYSRSWDLKKRISRKFDSISFNITYIQEDGEIKTAQRSFVV